MSTNKTDDRLNEERWIEMQPMIDQILFYMLIAVCIIGGSILFTFSISAWL